MLDTVSYTIMEKKKKKKHMIFWLLQTLNGDIKGRKTEPSWSPDKNGGS